MLLQRTLRYLRDFLVIIACLLAGKAVAAILPFAFPGSIIGMLLLFVLLSLQIVRFSWVELGAACCCATWGAVRAGGGGPGGLARAPCANPSVSSCSASCSASCSSWARSATSIKG